MYSISCLVVPNPLRHSLPFTGILPCAGSHPPISKDHCFDCHDDIPEFKIRVNYSKCSISSQHIYSLPGDPFTRFAFTGSHKGIDQLIPGYLQRPATLGKFFFADELFGLLPNADPGHNRHLSKPPAFAGYQPDSCAASPVLNQ